MTYVSPPQSRYRLGRGDHGGQRQHGWRKALGLDIGRKEAETYRAEFLRKLRRRGLRGVKPIISDAHEGIKAAFVSC